MRERFRSRGEETIECRQEEELEGSKKKRTSLGNRTSSGMILGREDPVMSFLQSWIRGMDFGVLAVFGEKRKERR